MRGCKIFGGFKVGTWRDGSRKSLPQDKEGGDASSSGTESNGGFEDIVFEDCFVHDGTGFLLTSVDGGKMAGVYVRNFTRRNIHNAPMFVWLGDRLRGPPGISVGAIEDINISGLRCWGYHNDEPIIISGLRESPISGFSLSDAYLLQTGGGTKKETYIIPPGMERFYPETGLLGQRLPAQGLLARYVEGLMLNNIGFNYNSRWCDNKPANHPSAQWGADWPYHDPCST